jgi:hypothetical protein
LFVKEIDMAGHLFVDALPVTGGGPGGVVSIADGADVAEGATTDAAVGDAVGTVNAHLRQIAKTLAAGIEVQPLAAFVAPAAQNTVSDTFVDLTGASLDTLNYRSVSFSIVNTGAGSIKWQVLGDIVNTFATAQVVKASANVLAAAVDGYSIAQAPWRFYKVQIGDTVNGVHGQATVYGLEKG